MTAMKHWLAGALVAAFFMSGWPPGAVAHSQPCVEHMITVCHSPGSVIAENLARAPDANVIDHRDQDVMNRLVAAYNEAPPLTEETADRVIVMSTPRFAYVFVILFRDECYVAGVVLHKIVYERIINLVGVSA